MPQLSSGHVFMSYSRRDDVIMRRVVSFLRKKGIKVWVDNEKLIPGTPIWEEEIEKAIIGSSAVVVVLSPESKGSEWVRREISLADQYRKRVFPVLASGDEEASITLRLINRQFVDIRENENIGLGSLNTALSAYMQDLIEQEEKAKLDAQKLEEGKTGQVMMKKETGESKSEKEENEPEYLANKKVPGEQISTRETSNLKTDNTSTAIAGNQKILWITLGWALGGLIGGFIYGEYSNIPSGAISGAIGGVVTAIALQNENILSDQKYFIRAILAWTIGGAIGGAIGWGLTEAVGAGIGTAIFAIIGIAATLRLDYILSRWKNIAGIILAWGIGGAVGWSIARGMIEGLGIDIATSWAIGTAIGWSIGGFVMGWQLTRR